MQARLSARQGSREHRRWLKRVIVETVEEKGVARAAQEWAGIIDRLEQERIRDPLTGAFNRGFVGASLQQMLEAEREHGHGVGLMMLDIDYFKSINDEEPDHHEAGDRVLVVLAKQLQVLCQGGVVGRWGGEEWLVVMPHADQRQLIKMAKKIGEKIARQLAKRAKLVRPRVAASLGVRMVAAGETPAEAIKKVDELMYQAKEGGRARVVYEDGRGKIGVVEFG